MPPLNRNSKESDIWPSVIGISFGIAISLLIFAALEADKQDYRVERKNKGTQCYKDAELEDGFFYGEISGEEVVIPSDQIKNITECSP